MLDIDTMPLDDAEDLSAVRETAQTYGIFQFESSGMREHPAQGQAAAPRRPDRVERALPARPAQGAAWWTTASRASRARREVSYELPQLEPILADTYGVIAYQEQVMRIAQALAGFSLGQADVLAQGHGQEGSQGHGEAARGASWTARRPRASARRRPAKIFELMEHFAGLRLQQVALDRVRVPGVPDGVSQGELPAALRRGAADHRSAEHRQARASTSRECRDRGIAVLPPDINAEPAALRGRARTGVRFGLTAIKGLGEGAIQRCHRRPRADSGRITSLHQLCEELDLRIGKQARARSAREVRRVRHV